MRTRVPLQRTPNSKFDGVARSIAKGDPPEWLLLALEHFSDGIGVDHTSDLDKRFDTIIERIQDGAHVLMTWLPIWEHLPYGMKCPKDVAVVLDALPRIKKDLDRLDRKQIGRRPKVQLEICAAVVVEAWKLLHGRAKPRSLQLQQACSDYWRACGGKQVGETDDPENWRRSIKRSLETDHDWVRRVLLAVQNPT
jgi:hypothetical protein